MSTPASPPPEGAGPGRENWEPWSGMSWRIQLSILGPVAWVCFTLLYVGFWAHGFSLFQSVIVILVSLILLFGIMGAAWAAWGMRRRRWGHWMGPH